MSKIAIITNIPSPYRVDLFYYLQTHVTEHQFHVIYTSGNEDNRAWTVQKEKLLNTHILDAKKIKLRNKLDVRYIHLPTNVGKVLSEIQPEAVIASEYNPAALQGLLWTKTHGKKYIHWTDGTLHSERNIGKIQKLMRKIICGNADTCIASSTKSKEKLLAWGVPEEKIFISLLTVDISQYQDMNREPIPGRILYVGRITRGKGLDLLMDALPHVKYEFQLHIVGDGDDTLISEIMETAKQKGIANKITFCGFKSGQSLLDEYRHASIFVLPTKDDCFGLVLLEAICAGVPVVSSKYADGAYDIILNGENGYIEDPYQTSAFGHVIEKALKESELLSNKNVEHIEHFSFAGVSGGFIKAIDLALKGNT